jgi:hypothetical protein
MNKVIPNKIAYTVLVIAILLLIMAMTTINVGERALVMGMAFLAILMINSQIN